MIELGEVVKSLAARDGVEAVLLLSGDGLPIEHAARDTVRCGDGRRARRHTRAARRAARSRRGARAARHRRARIRRRSARALARRLGRLARAPRHLDCGHRAAALRPAPASLGAGRAALMRWAVLLAGGSGTRFWPLSTPRTPKQLLPLSGVGLDGRGGSRAADRVDPARARASGGRRGARRPTAAPARPRTPTIFWWSRCAASTAPALIWATWEARRRDPDAEVLSLHADWVVGDAAAFRRDRRRGAHHGPDARPAGDGRRGSVAARDRLRVHRARRAAGRAAPAPSHGSPRSPTPPPRST